MPRRAASGSPRSPRDSGGGRKKPRRASPKRRHATPPWLGADEAFLVAQALLDEALSRLRAGPREPLASDVDESFKLSFAALTKKRATSASSGVAEAARAGDWLPKKDKATAWPPIADDAKRLTTWSHEGFSPDALRRALLDVATRDVESGKKPPRLLLLSGHWAAEMKIIEEKEHSAFEAPRARV